MISTTLLNAIGIVTLALLVLALVKGIKAAFITNLVTIQKTTDDGEVISLNANFTVFDTEASKRAKVETLVAIPHARMVAIQEAFQEKVREVQALQAEKKGPKAL